MSRQAELTERLRARLSGAREVSMFGGRSFMVNGKIVASALRDGDLLVRVDAARHDELVTLPGASQAQMGAERDMGAGWIAIDASSLATSDQLSFWIDIALEYNRTITTR